MEACGGLRAFQVSEARIPNLSSDRHEILRVLGLGFRV